MVNPEDRVLLVRLQFSDRSRWVLPGGGKEGEEDDATALRRELMEETGAPEVFIGPKLWIRRMINPKLNADYDGQEETAYLVPCHGFEIKPSMTTDELHAEGLMEHRWWSVEEMESTEESLRPVGMVEIVKQVLEFGAPAEPFQIDR